MTILHISDGWETTNGVAVAARLIGGKQEAEGHVVRFRRWAGIAALRSADEVWVHCAWRPCLWWASLFARRLVRMPHGSFDPVRLGHHGSRKRLFSPLERMTLRRAERVVATCADERQWIASYEPRARVETVDLAKFFDLSCTVEPMPKDRPVHLLYLGRRHPLKGVEILERAARGLARAELRIESGLVGREKDDAWAWCDVLVLPTLSENFGLVVAEALERGKRVITTDGAPAWRGQEGVVYLEGFRSGSDESRVELLRGAIEGLTSRS